MKKIWTFLEWKPAGHLRKKWKKNSKEFKRNNKIKLIKFKNRKKKFEIPKNWKGI